MNRSNLFEIPRFARNDPTGHIASPFGFAMTSVVCISALIFSLFFPSSLLCEEKIEGVPFFRQKGKNCGSSAIASILKYWGKEASYKELTKELSLSKTSGSLTLDLEKIARSYGLWTFSSRNTSEIKENLKRGIPGILLLNLGAPILKTNHYVVLSGFDEKRRVFIGHSGYKKDAFFHFSHLEYQWKKAGNWSLFAIPIEGVNYYNQGNFHLEKKEYEKAINNFLQAIKLSPDFTDAYNNLAWTYLKEGKVDLAKPFALKATSLSPKNPFILDTLGMVYFEEWKKKERLSSLKKAAALLEKASKISEEKRNKAGTSPAATKCSCDPCGRQLSETSPAATEFRTILSHFEMVYKRLLISDY